MGWVILSVLVAAAPPLPLVAIDPGHGGEQTGAIGPCGAREKDLALAVSTELGRVLVASGRARVALTRVSDQLVELDERYRSANAAGAALFVSVHANASPNTELRGVETYLLSRTAADRRLKTLAERENEGRAVPGAGDDNLLAVILDGLELNASHVGGQRLAIRIQESMKVSVDTRGRGVLQAPFIVLLGAQMPAVLVEIGFVTNADECRLLATVEYQQVIARALAGAILEHLASETPGSARQ